MDTFDRCANVPLRSSYQGFFEMRMRSSQRRNRLQNQVASDLIDPFIDIIILFLVEEMLPLLPSL